MQFSTKNLRPPPPHPFIVPPGMAYAARCANEAERVRLARERVIFDEAFLRGADAGHDVAKALA